MREVQVREDWVEAFRQEVVRLRPDSIVLAGGRTPGPAYARLASEPLDWRSIDLFWTDERAVPPTHSDSNYGMACDSLLSRIPVGAAKIHRIRMERPPADAAEEYDAVLRAFLESRGSFDLVVLGLGPDGHTASLFEPESRTGRFAVIATDPRGRVRVTMTEAALERGRRRVFLVAGAEKAEAVREAIDHPDRTPAGRLGRSALWILDPAAAGAFRGV